MENEKQTKEQIYDEYVSPLIRRIDMICERHGIQYASVFHIPIEENPMKHSFSCNIDPGAEDSPILNIIGTALVELIDDKMTKAV